MGYSVKPFIILGWLLLIGMPIACISWTVTHEEIFKEPREFCARNCKSANNFFVRKFFYVFTCGYCFSHYVTIVILVITHFKIIFNDWRGYLLSGFALVWIANMYMSIYELIRSDNKKSKDEAILIEHALQKDEGHVKS